MRAIGMEHLRAGRRAAWRRGAAVGVVIVAGIFTAGCDQPKVNCSVARGNFAARYTLLEGEGDCAALTGEILGIQAYNERTSASDARPNYERTSIGIQPASLGGLLSAAAGIVDANAEDLPYGLGKFSSAKPTHGQCEVPTLSSARVRLPVIPEHDVDACTTTPEQPEVDIAYVFSNVRVVDSAKDYGTKLEADLTYTANGCTAKYKVEAIYPAVACDAAVYPEAMETPIEMDDNGDPICPSAPEPVEPIPSADMCSPVAIPERGIAAGSGISVDFPVECDPVLLHCVLK